MSAKDLRRVFKVRMKIEREDLNVNCGRRLEADNVFCMFRQPTDCCSSLPVAWLVVL